MSRSRRLMLALVAALAGGPLAAVLVTNVDSATASATRAILSPASTAASPASGTLASHFAVMASAQSVSGRLKIGSAPLAPLKSRVLGPLAGTTQLSVAVTLAPRDAAALASFATAVSTPGSAQYHRYLTVRQFRARFGASDTAIASMRSALTQEHLQLGATSANGLSLEASGTAAQLESAFGTTLARVQLPSGRVAYSNTSTPSLPANVGADVQAVLGLSDVFVPHRLGLVAHTAQTHHASSLGAAVSHPSIAAATPTDGAISDCAGADGEASMPSTTLPPPLSLGGYTGQSIAQAYDYDPLYAAGDEGQGVTVGIFELEPNFPADITAFESCYGISAPVSYISEDGGVGTASASDDDGIETELDIENIIELAPKVNVDVYQAPNSNDGLYDNYSAMVTNPALKVISSSWGECESEEGAAAAAAENTLFEEGATQGISMAAASGDSGAQDCEIGEIGPIPTPVAVTEPQAAVDDPASQPFVTGVGGTSLNALGDAPTTRPTEVVWNNGVALAAGESGGAGGGGDSALWQMPTYQSGAASGLNVVNDESSATTCEALQGDCREVPDVSADADLYTGYVIYWDGQWTSVGGTSGAAPLWASLFAEADADSGCQAAGAIGFANPALYAAAGRSTPGYASDFNDITSGNNDLYDTNGGEFVAASGYDMASGLGTPVAANLAPALCGEAADTAGEASGSTTTVTSTVTTPGPTTTVTTSGPTTTITAPGPTDTVTSPGATQTVTTTGGRVTTPGGTVTAPGAAGAAKPAGAVCKPAPKLSFVQHPAYPSREIKAVVSVNGKVVKTVKGKRIVDVVVTRPKASKFTVKLVATLSSGEVISHQVVYSGCAKPKVTTRVLRPAA